MAETLGAKQRRFTRMTAAFLDWGHQHGYEFTEGRGWESEAANKANGGKKYSNHLIKLAHDWNVFKDGRWLKDGAMFRDLGAYWKQLTTDACWGGDWGDGNHFSIEYGGHK